MVKFARVLVDVEISDKLPHSISFLNECGQLIEQTIEYEWLPTKCSICKSLRHAASICRWEQRLVWQPKKEQEEALEKVDEHKQVESEPVPDTMVSTSAEPVITKETLVDTVKETSLSTEDQVQVWTTPKRVSGAKHMNEEAQPSKNNQYSVLKDGQLEVPKHGAFLESKLRGSKIEDMMNSVFRDWKYYSVPIVEGRILLVWKEDFIKISVLGVEDQFIHCTVKIMGVLKQFCLTVIYGRNQIEERKRLWQALESLRFPVQPWLVAGDFNAIFYFDDRIGGRSITDMEREDACTWRANCLMSEICRIGTHYTWSNKQKEGSRIFSKLDRAFGNEAWTDAFPNSEAHFNWDVISDHCYCVIKPVLSQISGVKPFKFFNMWTKHEEFKEIVLNSWCTKGYRSDLLGISQKLNILNSMLVQFNRRKVGDITDRYLEAKEKYQQTQFLLQQQPQSIELQRAEQEACTEFNHCSKMHESFLRQRSNITWLRYGDDNTAYFYATLKQRSATNRITAFMDEHGQIVDCYEDVIKHFVNHFKGFLGSPSSTTTMIQLEGFKLAKVT
ncbi:uncharacterized protein LOC133795820 [Humulus lupulus]|uniref:uncharacterized protein LOC133795820 n=1 Tax=Humulus lupulus TaxID=3486 RepID=UPI002B416E83|nr:uncharacterized protein LOC133795820 [Humulus lupulus]